MIRPSTAEPIAFLALDGAGDPVTGLTTVSVRIFNPANGQVWDWASSAFSATPSQATEELAEVSSSNAPGWYSVTWPGTATAGLYIAEVTPPEGLTASDEPVAVELRVRQDSAPGDQMALTSGERTTVQGLILSDGTPFPGARVDAAISTRSSHAAADIWAVGARTLTGIGSSGIASQASVDSLPNASAIGSAVWATAETGASGTMGYAQVLMRKWITNEQQVDTTSSGRMRLFDDDGQTVLLTWTLRDASGNAITTPSGSPARRGEAS